MPARLAQHLITRGLLPIATVEEAHRRRAAHGGTFDTVLLELGAVSEPGILQAIADVSGLRAVNLADFEANPEMARFIPANVAERLCAVPLSLDGGTLHVATAYPPQQRDLEEVALLLGKKIELWIAVEVRIRDWMASIYGAELAPRFALLLQSLDPSRAQQSEAPAPIEDSTLEDALTREMVEQIARAIAEEPILLEVRKKPRAAAPESVAEPVPHAVPQGAPPAADATRVVDLSSLAGETAHVPPANATRVVDLSSLAGETAHVPQETRAYDLSALAQQTRPRTWDREETVALQLPEVEALARASRAAAMAVPEEDTAVVAASSPSIAPVIEPSRSAAPFRDEHWGFAAPEPADPGGSPGVFVMQPSAAALPTSSPSDRGSSSGDVHAEGALPSVVVFPDPPSGAGVAAAPNATAARNELVGAIRPAAAGEGALAAREWSLADARRALQEASSDRDRLIEVTLAFALRTFDFVAAFAVVRGQAVGWAAEGTGAESFRRIRPSIPLDAPSVFRTVTVTRGSYVGPLPQDALTANYLLQMNRTPRTLFLYPVEVKERLVCLLYGDPGSRPISQRRLADLLLFCQELPDAFGQLLLQRKQRGGGAKQSGALSFDDVAPGPARGGMGWSPAVPERPTTLGRTASLSMAVEDVERTPTDFTPLLRKLTGPDAWARSTAFTELARSPDASARVLAKAFPGPTAWSRLPVAELPDPEELGPIPAALARLGRPGAQALAPLLDAPDPDVRYFALLTAGSLPHPEVVSGVLRGLFDYEPDISSAARASAAALRRLSRFTEALGDLRQELTSQDTLRQSLAARALGVLHDRDAMDGLIGLTGSEDELCAQAAAEALREITKLNLGADPRRWSAWWAENRGRRRAEWLVAALRHADVDVRLAAAEELSSAAEDNLGYFADGPLTERAAAVARWEAALTQNERLRRL